ncbi:HNH endonuclease [Cryobacterium melibiosiphilum]|uniref:HNH endonuclease n=1 Tax=Cryobacterium melibiosiphilum TaxID=995039 RepID=A0A3A5MPT1_9MICO|nr:HNH endonuclease signature motif containing protein [Cryobacterium melibiosiphilum]RJT88076.1 HNH endonuclease [Cryobacterium melibiosiphilum]
MRRRTILPKSPKTAPKTFTNTARAKLHRRQGAMCPWCGHGLDIEDMHAHHRLLRGQGGTWDLANIVGLHAACHDLQPGSVHQEPAKAYRLGFMIRTKLLTPAQIPIYSAATAGWLLADGDLYQDALRAEAAELIALAGVAPRLTAPPYSPTSRNARTLRAHCPRLPCSTRS